VAIDPADSQPSHIGIDLRPYSIQIACHFQRCFHLFDFVYNFTQPFSSISPAVQIIVTPAMPFFVTINGLVPIESPFFPAQGLPAGLFCP
jgi:hypothetical protein